MPDVVVRRAFLSFAVPDMLKVRERARGREGEVQKIADTTEVDDGDSTTQ